jgi:serine/threonine protein kinase/formylglycine-generating enzyme required for sulfatase activity
MGAVPAGTGAERVPNHGPELRRVLQEIVDRRSRGEEFSSREYLERYPHLREALAEHFETLKILDGLVRGRGAVPTAGTILDDFRVLRELGRGGMGVVFLAEQVSLHRLVALKLLGAPLAKPYRSVERFRREAEIAARLRHPNLVAVYAEGESHGYHYFAMEYVEGVPLSRLLERIREINPARLGTVELRALVADSVPPEEEFGAEGGTPVPSPPRPAGYYGVVAHLVAEVAEGLATAHSHGVIHRDVKPSNVLVDRDLSPHLADFGLAREEGLESLSVTGDLVGTPYYLSPEMAMAGRIRVDHRTDIYSLGVTLFELLTLRLPFSGRTSNEVLRRIILEPPPRPRRLNRAVPPDLQVIALKAMEKDPAHRYASAAEMAEDLRRFLRFEPIRATPPGPLRIAARTVKRHRIAASFTALALLAGSGGAILHSTGVARRDRVTRLSMAEQLESRGALAEARGILEGLARADPEEPRTTQALRRVVEKIESEVNALLVDADEAQRRADAGEDEPHRTVAALKIERALWLRGREDPALRRRLEEVLGQIEVSFQSEPAGADVILHDVHEPSGELGPARALGRTPLRGIRLTPGWYRAVVEVGGLGYAETSFELRRGEGPRIIEPVLRPTETALLDMFRIPGGRYRVGFDPTTGEPSFELSETVVEHPAFYIDRTEVSNRAYGEFVAATGWRPPRNWTAPGGRYQEGEANLPVTEISWHDALAFAEWAGKRLPTEIEWEIACRGAEGHLYPWGPNPDPERASLGPAPPAAPGPRGVLVLGLGELAPVDGLPEGRSSFGLFHMIGNAKEWVWDPWKPRRIDPPPEEDWPSSGARVLRGRSALDIATPRYCTCAGREGFPPATRPFDVGFRCAKSVRE